MKTVKTLVEILAPNQQKAIRGGSDSGGARPPIRDFSLVYK